MREHNDHVISELVNAPHSDTGKAVRITRPTDVLTILDKRELHAQLDHYATPFIKLTSPDSTAARKWYVEKVRPALRYYCIKFGVKIPEWLKNEDYFKRMSDKEKQDYFGTTKLSFREFKRMPMASGGQVKRGD